MKSGALLTLGATFAIVVACGSFDGSDATPALDGGADSEAPLPDACSSRVLYVSGPQGNDGNDGCSPERAIKTISAALAFAAARNLNGFEVRVCGGVYAEPEIRMTTPLVVRGGFNCVTWTRGPENVTRVESSGYPSSRVTWTISGRALGREAAVDGITIVGAPAGDVPATAMVVADGARPLLANLQIIGGATKSPSGEAFAALGLDVRGGASPEVAACNISGGSGVSTNGAGSIGVFVRDGGSIDIHDSVIESGNGTGAYGGMAVRLVNAPKSRIAKTRFSYRGTATNGSPEGAYGVYATGGELEISDSYFRGVTAGCGTAAACKSAGVVADGNAKISVVRTAVYGGDVETTAADQKPLVIGIYFGTGVEGTAMSNVVHAGATASDPDAESFAIDIATTKSTRIAGNTLLSTGGKAAIRAGIRIGAPSGMGSGTAGNVIEGNVFVGRGGEGDIAIGLASCGNAKVDVLGKNLFLNHLATLLDLVGGNCAGGEAVSVARFAIGDLQQHIVELGGAAAGNLLLRSTSCAECIPGATCADASACAAKVFAALDEPTGGLTNIETPQGLRFSPAIPCAVAHATPSFEGEATKDFFGTARTAPFAVGHHEIETCTE